MSTLKIRTVSAERPIRFCASPDPIKPDCFLVQGRQSGPVLVAIHGISRNAAEMVSRFAASPAFREHTIVAPLFEAERFGQYQQLRAKSGQVRSDLGLRSLLDHLPVATEVNPTKVDLFGFSGGGQMAHRFAMFYPNRVSSVLAVAAGWYMMPIKALHYPYGVGAGAPAVYDPAAVADVAITVAVGSLDTRRDKSLRQSKLIETSQGRTRLLRARTWVEAMRGSAMEAGRGENVKFELLKGGIHEFGQCARDTHMMELAAKCSGEASVLERGV